MAGKTAKKIPRKTKTARKATTTAKVKAFRVPASIRTDLLAAAAKQGFKFKKITVKGI